jgi:hypothetical protein
MLMAFMFTLIVTENCDSARVLLCTVSMVLYQICLVLSVKFLDRKRAFKVACFIYFFQSAFTFSLLWSIDFCDIKGAQLESLILEVIILQRR